MLVITSILCFSCRSFFRILLLRSSTLYLFLLTFHHCILCRLVPTWSNLHFRTLCRQHLSSRCQWLMHSIEKDCQLQWWIRWLKNASCIDAVSMQHEGMHKKARSRETQVRERNEPGSLQPSRNCPRLQQAGEGTDKKAKCDTNSLRHVNDSRKRMGGRTKRPRGLRRTWQRLRALLPEQLNATGVKEHKKTIKFQKLQNLCWSAIEIVVQFIFLNVKLMFWLCFSKCAREFNNLLAKLLLLFIRFVIRY